MLEIDQYQTSDSYHLALKGMLDIFTIDTFNIYIDKLPNITTLTINLSGLTFIDSTGIGGILRVIYLSKEQGFRIKLEGMNENIREMLETVGVLRILEALQRED
jgi:anti-anti-sigma factor